MKKVLVTGGAGFIGSHIVEALLAKGRRVTVVDDLSTGFRRNLDRRATFIKADICDKKRIQGIVRQEKPACIIHLAAQMNVRHSILDPQNDATVNIVGGINILEACVQAKVKRIVFASSGGAVYGDQPPYPCPETTVPLPDSPYAIAKYALEHYSRFFAQNHGAQYTALRLSNVYGPRQNPKGEAGVISIFLDRMLRGETPVIFGDGSHTRDYVWVGDVADAFLRAMTAPPGIYNIGTGLETSTLSIYRMVRKLVGFDKDAKHGPEVHGEVDRNSLDCRLARRRLNWSPKVKLEDGMERLIRYMGVGVG
jgi:UDP-glucose 4-epimerase